MSRNDCRAQRRSTLSLCGNKSDSVHGSKSQNNIKLLFRVPAAQHGKQLLTFCFVLFFFFSSCPFQSGTAHFRQKPIKARAESSLRQPSHSGMQAPGLATSRHPVEERQRDSAAERQVGRPRKTTTIKPSSTVAASPRSEHALGPCAHA